MLKYRVHTDPIAGRWHVIYHVSDLMGDYSEEIAMFKYEPHAHSFCDLMNGID